MDDFVLSLFCQVDVYFDGFIWSPVLLMLLFYRLRKAVMKLNSMLSVSRLDLVVFARFWLNAAGIEPFPSPVTFSSAHPSLSSFTILTILTKPMSVNRAAAPRPVAKYRALQYPPRIFTPLSLVLASTVSAKPSSILASYSRDSEISDPAIPCPCLFTEFVKIIGSEQKMQSGDREVKIVAGKIKAQYDCYAGITASRTLEIITANAPKAKSHCTATLGINQAVIGADRHPNMA